MKDNGAVYIKSNTIQLIKIAVILIITVSAVFSVLNINKYTAEILNIRNTINIKSNELKIKNLALENYSSNKTTEINLKDSLTAIKEKINPYPAIQKDIINLDNILARNNLTTSVFSISSVENFSTALADAEAAHTVYYAVINITAAGNYYDALSAYGEITSNERWYDIKKVNISSKEMQNGTVIIDMAFNIYFIEKILPSSAKIETYNIYRNENPFSY